MQLVGLLEKMKMDHLASGLDTLCEQAGKRDLGYREFLVEALQMEWQGRHRRGVEGSLRISGRETYIPEIGGFSRPHFCVILLRLDAYMRSREHTEEERHLWQRQRVNRAPAGTTSSWTSGVV